MAATKSLLHLGLIATVLEHLVSHRWAIENGNNLQRHALNALESQLYIMFLGRIEAGLAALQRL